MMKTTVHFVACFVCGLVWLALGCCVAWAAEGTPPAGARQILDEHIDNIYSCSFAPNGGWLASASGDNTVVVWDVAGQSVRHVLQHDAAAYCAVFSPDGSRLWTRWR
jgi:WD40 repeat protein